MPSPDDIVTLKTNSVEATGWDAIRISRAIDRVPSDFDISLTERNPDDSRALSFEPGQSCTVYIGDDPVLTGWIDRVSLSASARHHGVRISGRGLCQDLTDCSITPDVLNGMQIVSSSLLELAQALAKPFHVTVSAAPGTPVKVYGNMGGPLQFNATLTETPWEILERVARYQGVLLYDLPDGSLYISAVGSSAMASGFNQGNIVEQATVTYSLDERYSVYLPTLFSYNTMGKEGAGGIQYTPARDDGVTRYRPLIIVSEQFQYGASMAEKRAEWEMARRIGRSQAVHLAVSDWRDTAKALWSPNAYAPVNLPTLKLTDKAWIIASVTFVKDARRGTVADVSLMPASAFTPTPVNLVPFYYDPSQQPQRGGAAKP